MSMRHGMAARLGILPREKERSVWIVARSLEDAEFAAPALTALAGTHERIRFIFTLERSAQDRQLLERFPGSHLWPLPFGNTVSCRALIQRGNVRLVIATDKCNALSPAHLRTLASRSVPLIAMPGEAAKPAQAVQSAAEHVVRLTASDTGEADGREGKMLGLSADEAAALFAELIARDQKELRAAQSLSGRIGQALLDRVKTGRGPQLLRRRFRYLANAADLRTALGKPQAIMCLGNGPSSEDASLLTMRHDALFRVNHSWLKRGFLADPDVVFTGGRPTLRALDDVIFGVRTPNAERAMMTVRALKGGGKPTRFFNVGNINKGLETFDWGHHRPSNGAAMIACAVALQPARLIVAGIDMFQHPAGSYPGDATTPNAYSPGHDAAKELQFLLEQFDLYQGDLVIVGDILRAHWTEFRRNKALAE